MGGNTCLLVASVVGVAGACGSSKGMELDVTGVASAEQVVVLVANGSCNGSSFSCNGSDTVAGGSGFGSGISWERSMQPLAGRIHEVIGTTTAIVRGKTATFLLEPADLPPTLGHVVIIAEDGSGSPVAMSVVNDVTPMNDASISVELQPVAQYPTTSKEQAIHIWSSTTESCFAWFPNGSSTDAEFFVPPDDHDCDNYLVGSGSGPQYGEECDDYWASSLTASGTPCATTTTTIGTNPCVLGTLSGCEDGTMAQPEVCTPSPDPNLSGALTCVPDVVCSCNPLEASCFTTLLAPTTAATFPQIDCPFLYVTTTGSGYQQCNDGSGEELQIVSSSVSDSFLLDDRELPPVVVSSFAGQFTVGSGSGSVSLTFSAAVGSATLEWAAGFQSTIEPPMSTGYFLEVDEPTPAARVLIPLVIDFLPLGSDACPALGQMSTCSINQQTTAADGMWTCAKDI